jgi:F0F1-type ATP synthase assembly protein I
VKAEGPFAKLASGFAVASTLGLGFAAATGLGIFLGHLADKALHWRFFGCTLTFGLLGGVAGMTFVVRTLRALEKSERRDDPPDPGSQGPASRT